MKKPFTKKQAQQIADKTGGIVGQHTTNGVKWFVVHVGKRTISAPKHVD